jgi:hypothetical protein
MKALAMGFAIPRRGNTAYQSDAGTGRVIEFLSRKIQKLWRTLADRNKDESFEGLT